MLIKLIYKILKKLIDNCDKFYLEETDPDVIEAKELLGRVEKAMKAKGVDANAHQCHDASVTREGRRSRT